MKNVHFMLTTVTGIFLSLSIGLSQSPLTYDDWDKNESGYISRSEFVAVFIQNFVQDWNLVDDPYFDDEDISRATYRIWDMNADDSLTEEEWVYGYDNYLGEYVVTDFDGVDVDNDGVVEYDEYYKSIENTDYYTVWDVNGDTYLNEYELARMVFNTWDQDDSNFIEPDEYQDFDSYYLDI